MKYTKPEIIVLGNAANAIQGAKGGQAQLDSNPFLPEETQAAYEADE
jgi:hypothetical protein